MTRTRSVLWFLLAVSAVGNVVTSTSGLNPLIGVGFGLLSLTFGGALVAHHRRHRRGG
jgi:hypothetical protein